MALSYNNGNQYLSDHDFISHGFHADIDAYGNEKIRDATIRQENQQRFGVCNEKSRLVEINERLDVAIAETDPIISRIYLSGLKCIEIKPSDNMKDHAKVELLFSIFDANGKLSFSKWHDAMADANMFAEALKKADLLFVMLSSRFQTHVKRKVWGCQQSNRVLGLGQKESCVGCLLDDCCMPSEGRNFLSWRIKMSPCRSKWEQVLGMLK